jgi:hypothetical protein
MMISQDSSGVTSNDKTIRMSYNVENKITVAIDNKVPILSNIKTSDLLDENSNSFS